MNDQLGLIQTVPWDVLIVLDACRADFFEPYAKFGDYQTVNALAPCTELWTRRIGPWLAEQGVVYFTAQPVVDCTVRHDDIPLHTVPVWKEQWGFFTPANVPGVHPMSVISAAILSKHPGRFAAHLTEPHSPYMGVPALAVTRDGSSGRPIRHGFTPSLSAFDAACRGTLSVAQEVAAGRLTVQQVHAAYAGSLALGWEAVRVLGAAFPDKRFVVTSDHGELLGEHGKWGHLRHWTYRELLEVPWLAATGRMLAGREAVSTIDKLEALGYA